MPLPHLQKIPARKTNTAVQPGANKRPSETGSSRRTVALRVYTRPGCRSNCDCSGTRSLGRRNLHIRQDVELQDVELRDDRLTRPGAGTFRHPQTPPHEGVFGDGPGFRSELHDIWVLRILTTVRVTLSEKTGPAETGSSKPGSHSRAMKIHQPPAHTPLRRRSRQIDAPPPRPGRQSTPT